MATRKTENIPAETGGLEGKGDSIGVGREVLWAEAAGLLKLADALDDAFVEAVARIAAAKGRVICSGIGKSGHVARKIAATLSSTGTAAYFVHPTEASHGDLGMIQADDVVLALSRSGETAELDDLVQYTQLYGVLLIAVSANPVSALGRAADIVLAIPNVPEACAETNAPTTSTTLTMALGDALAVALLRARGFDAKKFKLFHPGGKLGAMLKTAGDLMSRPAATPLTLSGNPLADGLREISDKNLGCVGVVAKDGALCGIITDGDIRRLIATGVAAEKVDDAMTRDPVTVTPDTLAASVLQLMNEKKITQVFVLEDGEPVGVVHMHDILRAGIL